MEFARDIATREISDADLDEVAGGTLDKALNILHTDDPLASAYATVAATVWQATGEPLLGPSAPSSGLL